MQILAPEGAVLRKGLLKHLESDPHSGASRALAQLVVFSFETELRSAANEALKDRPAKDSTDVLLQGLRYPWPAISRNAAAAITKLERKDLVPDLVAFLDEPDPRAPVVRELDGRKATVVRELVRINHLQNCLLCHPPGNTPDVEFHSFGRAKEVLTGQVPIPGEELRSPSLGYGSNLPDLVVRADVTYLRQDFSRRMRVKDAGTWPETQRFDFVVRTREVSEKEAAAYRAWRGQQGAGYLSPNHQAALEALRALTGRDAGPTAQAWRKLLDL
jgi:hypothetical protein